MSTYSKSNIRISNVSNALIDQHTTNNALDAFRSGSRSLAKILLNVSSPRSVSRSFSNRWTDSVAAESRRGSGESMLQVRGSSRSRGDSACIFLYVYSCMYYSDQGDTVISISDSVISLTGQHNVIGRAIVIHADPDDLGRGNSELSKTTGNSGARVACGVIGIL
ncbi:hypothetical protein Y032_0898g2935 [Ancylostoma ceylanicum]|uniref:Superoxide dismutase [Cu-Zn] n=1 Tax=Ancylostoma ceylanicum TaxID=53326 RepID=A0A016W9W1_9BILA|nr:hypothetical protein Y032_0898g2935 [Ancylostoma ceylanicum]